MPDQTLVSPDTWHHDFALVSRPGNDLVQLALFADYASNLPLYPKLHAYLRDGRVPLLAVWGRNDEIFGPEGALAFADDAPGAEICLLDGATSCSKVTSTSRRPPSAASSKGLCHDRITERITEGQDRPGRRARQWTGPRDCPGRPGRRRTRHRAGRNQETLPAAYAGEPGVSTEMVDLTDEASIAALGERLGTVDHVVCTASARVRGRIADLDRDAIRLSFDTKVIGPLMLAKHLAPRMNEGGSFVLFSGVAAAKIAVGTMGVAITNAAADTLARSLALELAPIRVNAISPGVIDTGAWDALGEQGKADYFADITARNPARRIGTPEDIAQGVLFALTNTFLTGQTLHIDGGEPLT